MRTLLQDIRFSARMLARAPVFTLVALLSLALGIGANTAIFSLLDQVLLRLLPVRHPEQLVMFREPPPISGRYHSDYDGTSSLSYPRYRDIRDNNAVFSGVIARFPASISMNWSGRTETANGELVSGNYFGVLGVHAAIGRILTPEDDQTPGAEPLAVLSYGFWQRRFGGDPAVLDKTVLLNNHPFTIVGVAQSGFRGVAVGESPDVFVPMMMKAAMTPGWDDLENRKSWWLNAIARLKPGVSRQQAETAMNTVLRPVLRSEAANYADARGNFRKRYAEKHILLVPAGKGLSSIRDSFSAPLTALMCMVGLVLLIACANVANLLIARAAARQKEMAIRLALGAGRGRIVRQLLAESVLLALCGGALGLLAANWGGVLLLSFLPFEDVTRSLSVNPDGRALLFTFALSLLTGILFGLAPAIQSTSPSLAGTLKEQTGTVAGGGPVRIRKALVIAQVALSLLLLTGAGLFARSLYNLKELNPGFRADHLITFEINPSLNSYTPERAMDFERRLRDGIAALPGVRAASAATAAVLADDEQVSTISVPGYREREGDDMSPHVNSVTPGFFAALGIPLVNGRVFTDADAPEGPRVAVVNEQFARHFFPNESPIGRTFEFLGAKGKPVTIMGVVKDAKYDSLREKPVRFVYVPLGQRPVGGMTFYVRTAGEPGSMAAALRSEVQELDPGLPVNEMRTMEKQIDASIFLDRVVAALSVFFGALATLLAAIGLYGVMAYTVARRTREIGVRMALGADRRDVLRLVMREVVMLAAIGIAIAAPLSFPLSRLIQSQLYGIPGEDPVVLALAVLTLASVALLAGFIPARRATRVDPLVALRYE